MESYFRVDVLDDHDGGWVWIVHEDFLDSFQEASDIAYELSLKRPNKVAKVVKITAEEILYYECGNGYAGKDR